MKKKKQILSVLLAVMMVVCGALPAQVNAAYDNNYTNTGDQRADIIGVAKTQIGYSEGSNNNNKYGAYFGNNYASWCAYFIVWCARQANIDSSVIKTTGWATADDLGVTYKTRSSYTPQSGDIIIFDYSPYNTASPASAHGDHVGLVEYVSNGYVHTIEGNSNDMVKRGSYSLSYSEIKGYGVPSYKNNIQTHSYATYYEGAHPHRYYRKCSCGDWYYTGENAAVMTPGYEAVHPHRCYETCSICQENFLTGATTTISSCSQCNPSCTGYSISGRFTGGNNTFYDSDKVEFTIVPKVNDRDADDSEIISIQLKIKCPNGSIETKDFGTQKTKMFYFPISEYSIGQYYYYAYVNTKYGSYTGSINDRCLSLTLASSGLKSYYYITNDVLYRRIKFSDLDTYLTVASDKNIVSRKRKNDDSQIWKLIKNTDNTYTIESLCNGEVLDVYKGVLVRGNNVTTYTAQGSSNQKWNLCKQGDKQWYIRPFESDSAVLDVEGGVTEDNTNVALWTYHGESSQKIEFEYPYKITYKANGGKNAPSPRYKEHDKGITLSTATPTRDGYSFRGWSVVGNSPVASYAPGETFTRNADTVLYAVWKENHSHSYTSAITTDATCTTSGVRTYSCSCGASYTESISVNPSNHTNTTNVAAVASTCTVKGYSAGVYCNDCKQYISGHTEQPLSAHQTTLINAREATYDADGYTGDTYCTVCKQTLSYGASIPKLTKPEEPTDPTNPTEPATQPTTQPQQSDNDGGNDNGKSLNFFQRIIQWIKDFFAKLFGR